jgi:hypothetical protein
MPPIDAPNEEETAITGVFKITDDSGEVIVDEAVGAALVFNPPDYTKGENGALYAAARRAATLQREGRTVRLYGPEGFQTRRYAPEYLPKGHRNRPYRVPCSVTGCPNWVHPVNTRETPMCREHFAAAPETAARVTRLNEARRRKQEAAASG